MVFFFFLFVLTRANYYVFCHYWLGKTSSTVGNNECALNMSDGLPSKPGFPLKTILHTGPFRIHRIHWLHSTPEKKPNKNKSYLPCHHIMCLFAYMHCWAWFSLTSASTAHPSRCCGTWWRRTWMHRPTTSFAFQISHNHFCCDSLGPCRDLSLTAHSYGSSRALGRVTAVSI